MKKLLFAAVAATLVLASCSKDQRAVNKMEGTWNVDKVEYADEDGSITDNDASGSYTFNKCKLKKDDWCSGSANVTFGGATFSENFQYRVTNDGETVEMREDANDTEYDTATIVELDKKKTLTIRSTDSDGNSTTTYLVM